nr:amino acid permease C-terminal domain-containing protein [Moraxella sp. CTOTU48717]
MYHCIIVSLIAGFIPADVLWDLTSMGTLIAFTVVSIGVILLRYRMPNALRGFKVPLFPVLPILSILACLYLISSLAIIVYVIAGIWVVIAGCYYFFVASKNSALEKHSGSRV